MLTPRRMKLSGERSRQRILQLRRDIVTGLKLTRFSEEGPSRLDSLRRPRRKRGEGIFDSRRLYTNIARPCSAEMRHFRCTRNELFGNFRPWFNHHSEKSPTENTPSTMFLVPGAISSSTLAHLITSVNNHFSRSVACDGENEEHTVLNQSLIVR